MQGLIEVAVNVIAPIFIVVGLAAVVARVYDPDPRPLSRLLIYLFSPFLVFDGIANSDLQGGEFVQIVFVAAVLAAAMVVVGWTLARLMHLDRKSSSAFILTVVLINAGNYGLPLNRFAFGEAGEQRALIYYVMTAVVANTIGIFFASRGSVPVRQALINVLKVPLPYATALALLVNAADVTLPAPIQRAVTLLGQAAVPVMLTVLGLQLARTSIQGRIKAVLVSAGSRLVIAPLIAAGLAALIGMEGLARQVSIIQSGMPTAVITGVLATEFGSDEEFTAAAILVSTLLSIGTLSVLLLLV